MRRQRRSFARPARNFNVPAATCGKVCVDGGGGDRCRWAGLEARPPSTFPGIYVHRIVQGEHEKRIEQRTVRKRERPDALGPQTRWPKRGRRRTRGRGCTVNLGIGNSDARGELRGRTKDINGCNRRTGCSEMGPFPFEGRGGHPRPSSTPAKQDHHRIEAHRLYSTARRFVRDDPGRQESPPRSSAAMEVSEKGRPPRMDGSPASSVEGHGRARWTSSPAWAGSSW